MKKGIAVLLSLSLILASGSSVFASESSDDDQGVQVNVVASMDDEVEYLQEIFTDIPLGEDGYVEDFNSNDYLGETDAEGVVAIYTEEVEDGEYQLQINQDGSYSVFSYEVEPETANATRQMGMSKSGSVYTVKWTEVAKGFRMTYKVTVSINSSARCVLSNKTTPTLTVTGQTSGYTAKSGSTIYNPQTQPSSTGYARTVGTAYLALNGTNIYKYTLQGNFQAKSGVIYTTVSGSSGTP